MEPREIIQNIEKSASLPVGKGDRFAGYAVIGLPFRSGHVLALRPFPASSVGRGYTSVWHRSPAGKWTFYSTVAPEQGCARYFGADIQRNIVAPIELVWVCMMYQEYHGLQSSHNVTGLLIAWNNGDESALEQLVPMVHAELHRLARRYMGGERVGFSFS